MSGWGNNCVQDQSLIIADSELQINSKFEIDKYVIKTQLSVNNGKGIKIDEG